MGTIDAIIVILRKKKLKQKDLTDHLGLSKNAVTEWKAGRNESWKKYLPQIAEFLGVSVDTLVGNPSAPVQYSPQKEKLIKLIEQLDEPDTYKLEGYIESLLLDPKYEKSAQGA